MFKSSVRAPGKVLILGGYCILERPNAGVVLAVTSSFNCVAQWVEDASWTPGQLKVRIRSEQWGGWKGSYVFTLEKGLVPDESSKDRNAYVEKPVGWTLYAVLSQGASIPENVMLSLDLLADNDFYSQQENLIAHGLPRTVDGLRALPANCEVRNKSAKTGLGSSAAMISSIVVCIHQQIMRFTNVEFCHRVAQLAHAAVQGKIGSGFDVCAALYGSMKYIRYDPAPLESCLSTLSSAVPPPFAQAAQALVECAQDSSKWNHSVEPIFLPAGMELLCADVAGGSETPSMSRKILDWKAKSDGTVWQTLIARNDRARALLAGLGELEQASPGVFKSKLEEFSKVVSKDWKGEDLVSQAFIQCRTAFSQVRESLRALGNLSGVPVEPKEQTSLCDDSLDNVPGVLACGVPGAGGFDAVFALVLGPASSRALEQFWERYQNPHGESKVCALLLRECRNPGYTLQLEDEAQSPKRTKSSSMYQFQKPSQ